MATIVRARAPFVAAVAGGARAGAWWYAALTIVLGWLASAMTALPYRGIGGSAGTLAGTVLMLTGAWLIARPPSALPRLLVSSTALLALLGGFAVYAATLWLPPTFSHTTTSFGLSLAKVGVVIFTTGAGGRAAAAVSTGTAVVVEVIAVWIGTARGYTWSFDLYTLIAAVVIVGGTLTVRSALVRGGIAERFVSRTAADESRRHVRDVARSQVAAFVHDTVLNDLAVLATSPPGEVASRLGDRLRATLALLDSPDWLGGRAGTGPSAAAAGSGPLVRRAIEDARDGGLTVELTGEIALLDRIDPKTERALAGAVAQCLVNTQRHANIGAAEVSVLGGDDEISVMVSDAGDGFDPRDVVDDRIGLRESVLSRIEEAGGRARIFARPGFGTTVLISVPVRGDAGPDRSSREP